MYKIAVIPGDGIGKTVVPEAVRVLESTGLEFDFQYMEVGYEVFKKVGTSVPEDILSKIKENSGLFVWGYNDACWCCRLQKRSCDLEKGVRLVCECEAR